MMEKKPNYTDLLKLFFNVKGEEFKLPDIDKRKMEQIQKFLKHLSYKEEKEISSVMHKLYGMLPENRFFKEDTLLDEIAELFARRKFYIDKAVENIQVLSMGLGLAFDILAYGNEIAVLINLYSTVEKDDVDEFIEDIGNFKTLFHEYRDHKVYAAMALLEIDEKTYKYAYSKGIFVIRKSGSLIKILNRKNFKAKNW